MDEFDFGDMSGLDFGDFDLSGLENMDLSGLEGLDLSGLEGLDLSSIEGLEGLADVDMSGLDFGDLDLSQLGGGSEDELTGGAGMDDIYRDTQGLDDLMMKLSGEEGEGGGSGLTRGLKFDSSGSSGDGLGLKTVTGRGEISYVDPETGATGLKSEYFRDINDLEKTGTPEQIARFELQKDRDYGDLFKATEGEGFDADATRGPGLQSMGGGQGLSKYIPADYDESGNVRKGTGGTLTQFGFLPDKGTRYAIGNPNSWINNPAKTGEKAIVSPGNVVRSTGDPSKPTTVTTEKGQTPVTPGDNKNIFDKIKDIASGKNDAGEKKDDWMKWIMMLMALDAMRNKGGGSSGAVIPSLSASRSTTPYAEIQKAPGYRPGQGGVQYFGPTVYRAAGGGIGALDAAGGRLLRGPGDGVSDDIVAQIGDNQPARLADGEYVLDARTVSEIGNGSTDAGADKIAEMVERIHSERRNAKRGEPSNADKKLLA
jgi:hypothetical protein